MIGAVIPLIVALHTADCITRRSDELNATLFVSVYIYIWICVPPVPPKERLRIMPQGNNNYSRSSAHDHPIIDLCNQSNNRII